MFVPIAAIIRTERSFLKRKNEPMIAVDVMSGEHPPETYIRGAVNALRDFSLKISLVGDQELIETTLKKLKFEDRRRCKVFHAEEVIRMHEIPSQACKKKKDASIAVCTRLVKEGKAEGLYSPGNTGATLISAIMNMGKIEGIYRPALTTYLPTAKGHSMLIDAGANMDCTPEYLAQFAIMGEVFANKVQGKKNPTIGILSIGHEKSKGNELSLKTHQILNDLDCNFVGNIEGYDISDGDVDVIVCDGYTGNIVLKVTERVFQLTFEFVKQEIEYHLLQRIGYALTYPAVKNLNRKIDPRAYGGAPFLGLNGSIVAGHGSSDATAAYNGINMVNNLVKNKVNDTLVKRLHQFGLLKKAGQAGEGDK
jgi:glycerol-3-phosphate acyltransferase PlsX